jgi:hypothetical protein
MMVEISWRFKMKKKINIKYMCDDVLETIKNNPSKYAEIISENIDSSQWIIEEFKHPYIEKKITIPDFEFCTDNKLDIKKLSYINSVLLHKSLKNLPPYVLSDERFWAWINFDKGYILSQILIPINKKQSRLKNHYFFGSGSVRRGMFFGVLSRLYYRAHLTYDAKAGDSYELTKYVNDNPKRFRNLTWRAYSSDSELVKKILRIQYKLELIYKEKMTSHIYEEIAKYISSLGSVTYVELLSENDLEFKITQRVIKILDVDITS